MKPTKRGNTTRVIAVFFPVAFLIGLAFLSLPLIRQGFGIIRASRFLIESPVIWPSMIVFGMLYFVMMLFGTKLHELMLCDKRSEGRRNWQKARRVYTFLGIITLMGTGILLGWNCFHGRISTWDQMTVLAVLWIAYGVLVIYRWFMKPDADLVAAFENGNDSKYVDERRQTVMAKSAQSALYRVLGIILVCGTLYDLLVTRMWPVRTVFEIVLICIVWFAAYKKWEKKL